jgi:adenylate kinase
LRIVLLGPPGAGKGTQAKKISEEYEICHISTGELLRKAVQENTPLGKKAGEYLDRGLLVPDEIIDGMVKDRLKMQDCERGFLLDGFPRTLGQAESLDGFLKEEKLSLDIVIKIQVEQAKLIERFTGRRTCKNCGASFHIKFSPPKKAGICDNCGGELVIRKDDEEETVKKRLQVYETQTTPLIDYYDRQKLLVTVDGSKAIDDVFEDIKSYLEGVKS